MSNADLPHHLFRSLVALERACWQKAGDATADRTLERLRAPMAELVAFAVANVISEMRTQPNDPQVQHVGVHILRAIIIDNMTAKDLVLRGGGVEALVQSMQNHPADEVLLAEALEAIDEIHGLPSLLQAMEHLRTSGPGVRAVIWAFHQAVSDRWSDLKALDPSPVVRTVLSVMDAHREDERILISGLHLLSDLTLEDPDSRAIFASTGGWEWILGVMEARAESSRLVQVYGLRVISALGRGGAWGGAQSSRCTAVIERALCRYGEDPGVQYWGLWAIQTLNGARALIQPLQSGIWKTPEAVLAALKCLGAIALGQGDEARLADMPAVVAAVIRTMRTFSERYDVLIECAVVLGHAIAFLAWETQDHAACEGQDRTALLASAQAAIDTLMQLLSARLADHWTVKCVCEAFAEILGVLSEESTLRTLICTGLFGAGDAIKPDDQLLSKCSAAHVSNDNLQATLMWVRALGQGVSHIVHEMGRYATSHAVQLPAIKCLGLLYGSQIELESAAAACLPGALRATIAAMSNFKDNLILQQHGCYALCAMAEHVVEEHLANQEGQEALLHCALAAGEAMRGVSGMCDGGAHYTSYNALYLRKEATRCIVASCRALGTLGPWLRERGFQELLADALRTTAESAAEGWRDSETEDTLCLEVLALCYVLGPAPAVLEPLRRWGLAKPAVVRAAADTVVELARSKGALAQGVEALREAGCTAELQAAMLVHKTDEELQGRLRLAIGFVGGV